MPATPTAGGDESAPAVPSCRNDAGSDPSTIHPLVSGSRSPRELEEWLRAGAILGDVPWDGSADLEPRRAPMVGEHERHLAISSVAQQVSQAVAVATAVTAITVLARRLSLA